MTVKRIASTLLLTLLFTNLARSADLLLVEAESFQNPGGWMLDTQFVHTMGSPYLLAHGLGQPVQDATTTVQFPSTGAYKVFVRTKDWVAPWKAPGQPGRFQLLLDNQPLPTTFGTQGADWFWHDGGTVEIKQTQVRLALHDLTGFDGRCDAILFSKDPAFTPPNDLQTLTPWRKQTLGLPPQPTDEGPFDLVVVGGGYAGMASSISAARLGLKVALIQDRAVLGGNGSSEIRVWSQGGTTLGKYPRLGEIVEEFADNAQSSPGTEDEFGDAKKEAIIRSEKNISLYFHTQVFAADMKNGRIASVTARDMRTSAERRFPGKFFVDCTGHATLGFLAGADFDMAPKGHMGMSNMWRWTDTPQPQTFPPTPWAIDLTMADFPYPKNGKAEWFWEGGFNRHPIHDLEFIRDQNLRAIYGAFNAMKNGDGKSRHANAKLEWVAYIGGNRESRLLRGDVVLTREDIIDNIQFPDGCVPATWSIDLHIPQEQYTQKAPADPFISKAVFDHRVDKQNGYPIPYRCFYSRNIPNLFMAGRDISVTRGALGSVRVMRTCGMMGEVVGKAASLCVQHNCTPRDVYAFHLDELIHLMNLPGRARRATLNDPLDPNAPLPEPSRNPAPNRRPTEGVSRSIDPKSLPGQILDDTQAKLTGDWKPSTSESGYIGQRYLHDNNTAKGQKSASFEFTVPNLGPYELRLAYRPSPSRATNVPVMIVHDRGETVIEIDQQKKPPLEHGFLSLGTFFFTDNSPGSVIIFTHGTEGHVIVDALQVLAGKEEPRTPGNSRIRIIPR